MIKPEVITGPPRNSGPNQTAIFPEHVHGTIDNDFPPNGIINAFNVKTGVSKRTATMTDNIDALMSPLYTIRLYFI